MPKAPISVRPSNTSWGISPVLSMRSASTFSFRNVFSFAMKASASAFCSADSGSYDMILSGLHLPMKRSATKLFSLMFVMRAASVISRAAR